jgi:hypothetical protein
MVYSSITIVLDLLVSTEQFIAKRCPDLTRRKDEDKTPVKTHIIAKANRAGLELAVFSHPLNHAVEWGWIYSKPTKLPAWGSSQLDSNISLKKRSANWSRPPGMTPIPKSTHSSSSPCTAQCG